MNFSSRTSRCCHFAAFTFFLYHIRNSVLNKGVFCSVTVNMVVTCVCSMLFFYDLAVWFNILMSTCVSVVCVDNVCQYVRLRKQCITVTLCVSRICRQCVSVCQAEETMCNSDIVWLKTVCLVKFLLNY